MYTAQELSITQSVQKDFEQKQRSSLNRPPRNNQPRLVDNLHFSCKQADEHPWHGDAHC